MIPRSSIPTAKSASTGWGNKQQPTFLRGVDSGNSLAVPVTPPAPRGNNWKTPPPASGSDWRTNTAPSPYRLRTGAFEPAAPTQLPATGIPLTSKLASMIDKDLRAAIAQADADTATPTDAQRESGNYKKGKFTWNGIGITIETAKGQKRTGVNKATKQPWSVTLKNSYGYIRGTDSAEPGDQMDVFVGPTPESEIVYVVDQNKQDGKTFDEHKVCVGCTSSTQAKQLYHDNYNKGWSGFRNITALTVPQFKNWLKSGDMTKPLCGQEFAKFHKTASFSDVLQEARRQLPGFHGWETAGGAVAGAGAGTAVQLARRMMQSKREKEQHGAPSLLRGAAVGAGLGAFGGNLVGDRARRYISNMPNPFGYNASARLNDMREAGWEGLLRGAILDQPIQGGKAQGGEGGSEQNKAMRRELMRRGFGVHTDSPATDWFQNSGVDAEGAPVLNLSDRLFNSSGTLQASALPAWKEVAPDGSILDWMAEPGRFGKPVQQVSNVFNRFSVTPYGKSMKMYDKWDFDLHPDEQNRAAQVLQKWRTSKLDEPEKREGMSLLARWLASKTIASKMPAFQQTFAIAGEGKKPDWLTEGETADYSNADNWNKDTLPTRLK